MKMFIVAAAVTALQFPAAAFADIAYAITSAHFDFDVRGYKTTITDLKGQYGEVGRVLRVSNLQADLQPGKRGMAELSTHPIHGYATLGYSVPFRLSYDLVDAASGEYVGGNHLDVEFGVGGAADLERREARLAGGSGMDYDVTGTIFANSFSDPKMTYPLWNAGISYYPHLGERPVKWSGELSEAIRFEYPLGTIYQDAFAIGHDFGGGVLSGRISGYVDAVAQPVPEPGTYAFMATGLGAVVLARRRRR